MTLYNYAKKKHVSVNMCYSVRFIYIFSLFNEACISLIQVEETVKDGLSKSMEKYEGVSSSNEVSIGWDLIFIGVNFAF